LFWGDGSANGFRIYGKCFININQHRNRATLNTASKLATKVKAGMMIYHQTNAQCGIAVVNAEVPLEVSCAIYNQTLL